MAADGLVGFRAAQRRTAAAEVNPASPSAAMTVVRRARGDLGGCAGAELLGVFFPGDVTDVQDLDLPVAAGSDCEGLRRPAGHRRPAGDAEGCDGTAELAGVRVADSSTWMTTALRWTSHDALSSVIALFAADADSRPERADV